MLPSSCCLSSELIHFGPSLAEVFTMATSVQSSTCLASASSLGSLATMAFTLYLEVFEDIASTTTVGMLKASVLPSMATS